MSSGLRLQLFHNEELYFPDKIDLELDNKNQNGINLQNLNFNRN